MKTTRSIMGRWVLGGLLLGLAFPVASWLVAAVTSGDQSISDSLADHPVTFVVAVAPLVLTAAGAVVGGVLRQVSRLQEQTEELAERVATEWSAEIHNNNVSLANAASLRSKYFAALSHDMKTPLSAIMGFASIAQDDASGLEPDGLKQCMADIETCASQLLEIVNNLQDAAKLEAGQVELQVEDIDGDLIADEVVSHMRPLAEGEHLEMIVDLRAATMLRGDTQRFRQILINLLSNALKYTEQGTVTVRSYADVTNVFYEVQDTGAGILPADMPKVFTPFEQTDVARTRLDSTGLGLPVSLGMAQAMGGTIVAESDGLGHGATFRLALGRGTGNETEILMASLPAFSS